MAISVQGVDGNGRSSCVRLTRDVVDDLALVFVRLFELGEAISKILNERLQGLLLLGGGRLRLLLHCAQYFAARFSPLRVMSFGP
jgi:hypothetical protein